jgi:hypothetical protein
MWHSLGIYRGGIYGPEHSQNTVGGPKTQVYNILHGLPCSLPIPPGRAVTSGNIIRGEIWGPIILFDFSFLYFTVDWCISGPLQDFTTSSALQYITYVRALEDYTDSRLYIQSYTAWKIVCKKIYFFRFFFVEILVFFAIFFLGRISIFRDEK